jgi:hypothetical protein
MNKTGKFLFLLSAISLLGCADAPSEASSQTSVFSSEPQVASTSIEEEQTVSSGDPSSSAEPFSSVAVSSDAFSSSEELSSALPSTESAPSSDIEPSSAEPSSSETVSASAWTLGNNALEETKESKYLNEYSFSILDSSGKEISFWGDYIQRGNGEFASMIQMKKGVGVIECRNILKGKITLDVYIRQKYYNGENHDYTGTPIFYVSSDLVSWTPITGEQEADSGDSRIYAYEVDEAYFRLCPSEANALYLHSISFNR